MTVTSSTPDSDAQLQQMAESTAGILMPKISLLNFGKFMFRMTMTTFISLSTGHRWSGVLLWCFLATLSAWIYLHEELTTIKLSLLKDSTSLTIELLRIFGMQRSSLFTASATAAVYRQSP